MDEATAAHILEPFFTTKESGTGLGLPTSAAIVKAHGGELEVETAVGLGTTIGFELASVTVTDVRLHAEEAPAPGPGRGRRVLVVDDEAAICELVRQTLDQRGFVTEVAQGREALELLTQGRRFDAVLTDVMMPGVQGDAIARRLAAEQPHAAVVLMSGMLPGPGPRAVVERNGAHFLAKPFTPATLLATLDAALTGRPGRGGEAFG
jgi:hypothetical protein